MPTPPAARGRGRPLHSAGVIEASPTAPALGGARLVATEGVAKRFGAVQALDGVTVIIDEPATGLLGANGAG